MINTCGFCNGIQNEKAKALFSFVHFTKVAPIRGYMSRFRIFPTGLGPLLRLTGPNHGRYELICSCIIAES